MPKFSEEFKVDIDMSQVNRMLEMLPAAGQKKALGAALRFSATPLSRAMRNNARRNFNPSSGSLAKAVGVRALKQGRGNYVAAIYVAPQKSNTRAWLQYMGYYGKAVSLEAVRRKGVRHAHLMEFGFTARDGRKIPARPFIRPAFEATKGQIGERFKRKLGQQVEKELTRIRAANRI